MYDCENVSNASRVKLRLVCILIYCMHLDLFFFRYQKRKESGKIKKTEDLTKKQHEKKNNNGEEIQANIT